MGELQGKKGRLAKEASYRLAVMTTAEKKQGFAGYGRWIGTGL